VALLEISDVTKEFGGLKALKDVCMRLEEGEIVSLIGPNGAGKTTLFNCITGTMPPSAGSIRFMGAEVVGLSPHEVARRGITRTFQHVRLFNQMTVLENAMVGHDFRGRTGLFSAILRPSWVGREEAENRESCLEAMSLFGERLLPRLNQPASALSYANRRPEPAGFGAFLRQPQAPRNRQGPGFRPQAPAPGRAHGRDESP